MAWTMKPDRGMGALLCSLRNAASPFVVVDAHLLRDFSLRCATGESAPCMFELKRVIKCAESNALVIYKAPVVQITAAGLMAIVDLPHGPAAPVVPPRSRTPDFSPAPPSPIASGAYIRPGAMEFAQAPSRRGNTLVPYMHGSRL